MFPTCAPLPFTRLLCAIACATLVVTSCGGLPPAPAPAPEIKATTAPDHVHPKTSDDAMATHEAQMAEPAALATHQALMLTPDAMATHEAEMHGTPTPVLVTAAAIALTDFTTEDFAGSGLCVMCHEPLVDSTGASVSITNDWRSTIMANAAKDPAWQAKVASEVARTPGLQDIIEKKCASCHTPMAETQAEVLGLPVALAGDGFLNGANPLHEAAMDGVSCTLCHQIRAENLGTAASFSGGYEVDASTNPPDRVAFGPYTNPFGRPMQMHTGYLPAFGAHTNSAALCGTCHNLITPYVDSSGQVAGEFPEQMPYAEWEHSAFGGSVPCQSCHMPESAGSVVISPMPGRLGPREPFFQHYFVGGNRFMVDLMQANAAQVGVTAGPAQLEATRARTVEQLGRAARLSVSAAALEGETVVVKLQIAPATGHKLPTSFPSRRAWLHVTVTDATGATLFESGRPEPNGSIEGAAADSDPTGYEPHYDVITEPDQVQIYEPIMADSEGKVTYTLLRAAEFLKDNRLLPPGTEKAKLPPEIAVHGAAQDDGNFVAGGDAITYRVRVGTAQGPFAVRAELLYQSLSYRFLRDMLVDSGASGRTFGSYLEGVSMAPDRIATVGVSVP